MGQVRAQVTEVDKNGVEYELRGDGVQQSCAMLLADNLDAQQINSAIKSDAAQKAGVSVSQVILFGGAQ